MVVSLRKPEGPVQGGTGCPAAPTPPKKPWSTCPIPLRHALPDAARAGRFWTALGCFATMAWRWKGCF